MVQNENNLGNTIPAPNQYAEYGVNVKIIGIGGAGNNAIDSMYKSGRFENVSLIAANTDVQDLERIEADKKIILGNVTSGGLGAGFHPESGKRAAIESRDDIIASIKDADFLIIMAGLGGGTGTGATPEIIKVAQELEVLVLTVGIMPFEFEGQIRKRIAQSGLNAIRELSDAYIVFSNDKLIETVSVDVPTFSAFQLVNDLLIDNIAGLITILNTKGFINIDFADLQRLIIGRNTEAYVGLGYGSGENGVEDAVNQAVSTPFINSSISDITFAIVHLTIGKNLPLSSLSIIKDKVISLIGRSIDLVIGVDLDKSEGDNDITVRIFGTDSNNSLL